MRNLPCRITSVITTLIMLCINVQAHAEMDPMAVVERFAKHVSDATNQHVNISGYVNAHYMNHDGVPKLVNKDLDKPLFQIREASIFTDITLTDSLLISSELEMSYDFSSKHNSGRDDRFEILFNYYYLDIDLSNALDWDTDVTGNLSIRAGRILVPFLHYNENKPNFRQNLMSQPFTAWQLAPVNNVAIDYQQFGWSDTGFTINWNYAIGDMGILDVKFSVINGLGNESAVLDSNTVQLDPPGMMNPTVRPRDGLANTKSEWDDFSDVNDDKAFVMKVSYVPFSIPLNIGASVYHGAWDITGDRDITMYGFHFDYSEENWNLKGELLQADVEQTAGINPVSVPGPAPLNTSTADYSTNAWYLEGAYIPFRYGENLDRFIKGVIRYDVVDSNDKSVFTPFDRSRVTLGLEWQFLRNIRMRAEWQHHRIDSFNSAPAPYVAAGGDKDIDMAMISFIAYF